MLSPRQWENVSSRIVLCTVMILFAAGSAIMAQYPTADTLQYSSKKHTGRPLRIAVDVNWTLGISATQFFKDYQFYLGGRASGFDVPIGVGFSIASYQLPNTSIGLSVGYYRAAVRETYTYDPLTRPDPVGPQQTLSQTILLSAIPAMLAMDYHPLFKQFTGYVGGGLGVCATHVQWDEVISPSSNPGARTGGIRYDAWHPTPLVNLHAGVSLGFDQLLAQKNRAGLFIEAGFNWMPVTAPFFSLTGKSMSVPINALQSDYTIHTGGFVLRAGFEIMLNEG